MSIRSTVIIHKEENWYVAQSVETGIASQGKTIDEAIENLREALELYFEDEQLIPDTNPVFVTTLEVAI